ncbi:MAG: hypothetical protein GTN78_04255, partial [Gemmatimonadales bacterium]|nr:hypothetical protein [Gemmatimonadales bacterium]
MNRRELNRAIFEGTARNVLWQPRLDTWIGHHAAHGTLPERFRGLDAGAIYDSLRCSLRYGEGCGAALEHFQDPDDMEVAEEQRGRNYITTLTIREGSLRTVHRDIWRGAELLNRRIEKYPVATAEDLRVLTGLVERQQFRPDHDAYAELVVTMGDRGEPTVMIGGSGFTELIKSYCGLAGTFYLLADHPYEVEVHLEACER